VSRSRRRGESTKAKWSDWNTALSCVTNPAVVDYFERELESGRESYLRERILRYRVAGKRRWSIAARNANAYVWQDDRFENDVEFWQGGLADPSHVKPVKNEECFRLFLTTKSDFQFFHDAVTTEPQSCKWIEASPDDDLDETDGED
jgi:hypothetical protein